MPLSWVTPKVTREYVRTAAGRLSDRNPLGVGPPEGAPVAVITDWYGNTEGDIEIMAPGQVSFYGTDTTLNDGDYLNARFEWDFGDAGGRYNQLRGWSAAHLYEDEPASDAEYTVTLTVTQRDGLSSTATRKVIVKPNTRAVHVIDPDGGGDFLTINAAWDGTSGSDHEFQLASGKTHAWTSQVAGSRSRSNILIRTTGSEKALIDGDTGLIGNSDFSGAMNLETIPTEAEITSGSPRMFDARSTVADPSIGGWLADIVSNNENLGVYISDSGDHTLEDGTLNPRAIGNLLLNVTAVSATSNNQVWPSGKLMTFLGIDIRHALPGQEVAFRGNGDFVLVHDSVIDCELKDTFRNASFSKFWYLSQSTIKQRALMLNHNNGSPEWFVAERCLLDNSGATADNDRMLVISRGSGWGPRRAVVRNSILLKGVIRNEDGATNQETEDVMLYRNTIIHPDHDSFRPTFRATDKLWSRIILAGNLAVGGLHSPSVMLDDATAQELNDREPQLRNNVFPVRIGGGEDVTADGAKTWADAESEFEWISGNIAKNITLDENHRPLDTSDADLLSEPEADMAQFAEDFYGNPRTGELWVAGAVDLEV